jgi:hypothetical protein
MRNSAAASPMLIPSRLAENGLQRVALTRLSDEKPATVNAHSESTPPVITASARPMPSSRAALAIALAPDAQALECTYAGPRVPNSRLKNAATDPSSCWASAKLCGRAPAATYSRIAVSLSPMPEVLVPTTTATRDAPYRAIAASMAGRNWLAAASASWLLRLRTATGCEASDGSAVVTKPTGNSRPGEKTAEGQYPAVRREHAPRDVRAGRTDGAHHANLVEVGRGLHLLSGTVVITRRYPN